MRVENDNHCFVCGKENPVGLQLDIHRAEDGQTVLAECTPPPHFQGWHNVLHGGILSTLVDEVITYVGIYTLDAAVMTAQLEVRFLKPAPIGERLRIRAWPVKRSRRYVKADAEVTLPDGTQVVRASGKCLKVSGNFSQR